MDKKRVTIYINDDVMKILDNIKEVDSISKSELINLSINEYIVNYIERKQKIKEYSKTL